MCVRELWTVVKGDQVLFSGDGKVDEKSTSKVSEIKTQLTGIMLQNTVDVVVDNPRGP